MEEQKTLQQREEELTHEQAKEFRNFHKGRPNTDTHFSPRSRHYGDIETITVEESQRLNRIWPEEPLI